MKLTTQAVEDLFAVCHEPLGAGEGVVEVDTPGGITWLREADVAANRDAIGALLAELPDQFFRSKGGGWSFLNGCVDHTGEQWTGMHLVVAKLFALGEAAGLVECLMPRQYWPDLPGEMPFYVVNDGDLPQNYEEPF